MQTNHKAKWRSFVAMLLVVLMILQLPLPYIETDAYATSVVDQNMAENTSENDNQAVGSQRAQNQNSDSTVSDDQNVKNTGTDSAGENARNTGTDSVAENVKNAGTDSASENSQNVETDSTTKDDQKSMDTQNAEDVLAADTVTITARQNVYMYYQFYDGLGVHDFCDTTKDIRISFELDGKTYNLRDSYTLLGLNEMPVISQQTQGTRQAYSVNVPSKINKDGVEKTVSWKIESIYTPGETASDYLPAIHESTDFTGDNNIYVFKKDAKVNFVLEILDKGAGENSKKYTDFEDDLILYSKVGNKETDLGSLKQYQSQITADDISEENDKTIDRLHISGLPLFTENDAEIIYYLKAASDKVKEDSATGDYYEPSYDNTSTANFGSNVTQAYSSSDGTTGGQLTLLIKGTTGYKATKYWLDDKTDTSKRPDATLTLWRYSKIDETSNYTQAAQVYKTDGSAYQYVLDKSKNYEEIILGVTNDVNQLPKYDPYGYQYIYLTREKMSGGEGSYEQIYAASVDADEHHTVSSISEELRTDGDRSLYDGGILANRITGTKSVKWKKIWNSGTYQTDLNKVTLTLDLFQTDSNHQTQIVEDKRVTLDNFLPETLIRSGIAVVPMYDSLGKPYTYTWKETNVSWDGADLAEIPETKAIDGTETGQKKVDDAVTQFVLPHNVEHSGANSDGGSDVEYYESKSTVDGDSTVITNTLKGKTTYRVDKLWAQAETDADGHVKTDDDGNVILKQDDNGNIIYGKDLPADLADDAYINIYLQKNGMKLADSDVVLKQTSAEKSDNISGSIVEGRDWTFEYTDLDKYDAGGYPIAYTGKEAGSEPAWHNNVAYDVTEDGIYFDMQIKNAPNPGNAGIKIRKDWKDAGDRVRRGDVVVAVYGTKVEGGTMPELIDTVTLTQANEWYLETETSKNLSDYTDIYVREIAIIQNGTRYEVHGGTDKPVYYDFNTGLDSAEGYATVDTVTTQYHNYEVSYTYDSQAGEFIIQNRRTGVVQIDACKIWKDDDNVKGYRGEGGKLNTTLTLIADNDDGYSESTMLISGLENTVSVKNVLKNSADYSRHVKNSDSTTDADVVQQVTGIAGEDGKEIYYFYNLPKYDSEGRVIHYSLKEEMKSDDASVACEYISQIATTGYSNNDTEYSQNTSVSTQTINVTNTLSAKKNVVFYKEWKDVYVNETLDKRPDIYLTLYRKAGANGTLEEVRPYVDRLWLPSRQDTTYHWKWEFENLPKYDSNGVEYTYYAVEGCSKATMNRYHYQEVELQPAAGDDVLEENGISYLPENGTFINRIYKSVVINGKKVWKNIPSGTAKTDLPQIEVNIYRTTNKDDADNPEWPANQSTQVQQAAFVGMVKPDAEAYKANYTWTFQMTKYTDSNGVEKEEALPQYTDDGELYYYVVREKVISGSTLDIAYEALPGEVNDYIITNTYDVDTKNAVGKITVEKDWDITATDAQDGWQHPQTTYKLYRYYVSNSGENTNKELVAQQKLTAESGDSKQTFTFDKLRIYAPNGKPYQYYVVEENQNGYTIKYITAVKTDGVDTGVAGADGVNQSGDMNLASAEHHQATVTYTNTYSPKNISLSGSKSWDDLNNGTQTRPSKADFFANLHLYRYAKAQGNGGAAAIGYEEVKLVTSGTSTVPYATFRWINTDEEATADRWTFMIDGVMDYAPNGSRWEYILVEGNGFDINSGKVTTTGDMIWNYEGITTSIGTNAKQPQNNVIAMGELKNSIVGSASVTKQWQTQEDNIRPNSITVKLQFKIGDAKDAWTDATAENLTAQGIGLKLKNDNGTVNEEGTYEVTAKANWKRTVTGLPHLIKRGTDNVFVHWRFVEIKTGDANVSLKSGTDWNADDISAAYEKTANGYIPSQTVTNTNKQTGGDVSKLRNNFTDIDRTQLTVTKEWQGDSKDIYNTRPKQKDGQWYVTVQLQSKLVADTDTAWQPVTNVNGRNVTRTITGDVSKDMASTVFSKLPKYDSQGNELEYRAVELNKDTLKANGYMSITESGTSESADQTTLIRNQLSPTVTLTVTKDWKDADGNDMSEHLPEIAAEVVRIKNGKEVHFDEGTSYTHADYTKIIDPADGNKVVFTDLPVADGYTYAVREYAVDDSGHVDYNRPVTDGYYKTAVYVMAEGEMTDADQDGVIVQNASLVNTMTKFSLDKKGENDTELTNDYTVSYDVYVNSIAAANKVFTWTKTKTGDRVTESVVSAVNADSSSVAQHAAANLITFKDKEVSSGANAICGLATGKYVLHETKALEGYERGKNVIFTLGNTEATNGTLSLSNSASNQAQVTDNAITLYDMLIAIYLNKKDINDVNGADISDGAVFTINGMFADGQSEKRGITSANMNTLTGLWIAGQTYTVTETKAPDGYELAAPFDFVITTNGILKFKGTYAQASARADVLTVKDRQINVNIRKVSTETFGDTNVALTDDYCFAVTPIDGSTFADGQTTPIEVRTDSDNPLEGKLVAGGTYKVEETKAPEGYELANAFVMTVRSDGTVTLAKADHADGNVDDFVRVISSEADNTVLIAVADVPIQIALKKVDATNGTKMLDGAVYELTDMTAADGVTVTFINDNQSHAVFTDKDDVSKHIAMKQGHRYRLKEVTAPYGYEVPAANDNTVEFTINTDGNLEMTDGEVYTGNGAPTITAKDAKTSFILKKIDNEAKKEISDEALELTVSDADGVVFTWTHQKSYELNKVSQNEKYQTLSMNAVTGVISGLPTGEYTVSETKTPYGYLTIDDFKLTLDAQGHVTLDNAGSFAEVTADDVKGDIITITDTVIRGHVRLTKKLAGQGNNNQTLDGVIFELYRVNGEVDGLADTSEDDVQDTKLAEVSTDVNGVWTTNGSTQFKDGLNSGTYYFVEKQTTADAVLDKTPMIFTIAAQGKTQPATVSVENVTGEQAVINQKFSAAIELTKLDASDEQPIDGVSFKLDRINTTADGINYPAGVTAFATQTNITDADGKLTFTGLTKGTYLLTETDASGYDITKTQGTDDAHQAFKARIVIGEADNGKVIDINAADDTHITKLSGTYNADGITNTRLTGTVSLHKIDGEDTEKPLKNVEFALQKKNADDTYTTCMTGLYTGKSYVFEDLSGEGSQKAVHETDLADDEGTLKITGIAWNTYRLVELTPAQGYSSTDKIMTANGAMAIAVASKDFEIRRDVRDIDLAERDGNLVNYRIKLMIKKTDVTQTEVLKGAQFSVSGAHFAEGNVTADNDGKVIVTTDAHGEILLDGVLVAGETYTIEEIKAPLGYERITAPFVIQVARDGSIKVADSSTQDAGYPNEDVNKDDSADNVDVNQKTGYVLDGGYFFNTITVSDRPIEVKLAKTDRDGKTLAGAVFTMTGEFADGSTEITLTDDNFETALNAKLIASTADKTYIYHLHEEKAPEGYTLMDDIYFTVDDIGNIKEVSVNEENLDVVQNPSESNADNDADNATTTTVKTPDYIKIASTNGTDTLTFEDEPIVLKINKRLLGDKVETGMANAEFTLTGEKMAASDTYVPEKNANGTWSLHLTTGEDGFITLDHVLVAGVTYTLTEIKAPDGAMEINKATQNQYVFEFAVNTEGKVIDIKKKDATDANSGNDSANMPQLTYTEKSDNASEDMLTVWDVPTALAIFKKGTDTKDAGDDADVLLKNCKFAVTGRFAASRYAVDADHGKDATQNSSDNAGIQTIYVVTNGTDTLENALKGRLIVGETYTIKEIQAPNGYEMGLAMTFTVTGTKMNADGQLVLDVEMQKDDADHGYEIAYDQNDMPYILQRDIPVELKIKKVNAHGEALANAVFDVTGIFGEDTSETTKSFVTDKDGYIDFIKQLNECISEEDMTYIYKLEETKAPDGYDKLESAIYFRLVSVEENGIRVSKVEVLYSDTYTSDKLRTLIAASSDGDMEILQITNNATPEKTNSTTSIKRNVKTGDTTQLALWFMMLVGSGAAGSGTLIYKKKRRKK